MNHQLKQTASKSLSSLKQIRINTIQTYKQQNADFFKKMCCYNFWATISVLLQKTPITETSSFDSTPWSCFVCEHVPVGPSFLSDQGVDGLRTTFWVHNIHVKKR